jgi:hypothetical protein
MRRFTFEDGSQMHIADTAMLMTNKGPLQADLVTNGTYVRCGVMFCRVDNIAIL